jgi:hypothetical protein
VKALIGQDRRDRWMRIHHPRLVKRRYLLLKSLISDASDFSFSADPVVIQV